MARRIPGQGVRDELEAIAGKRVGHDEHPGMSPLVGEEAQRKRDKVVAVPGHEAASFPGRAFELLQIRERLRAVLVGAHGFDAPGAQELGDLRAQVFVQVVFQNRCAAREG